MQDKAASIPPEVMAWARQIPAIRELKWTDEEIADYLSNRVIEVENLPPLREMEVKMTDEDGKTMRAKATDWVKSGEPRPRNPNRVHAWKRNPFKITYDIKLDRVCLEYSNPPEYKPEELREYDIREIIAVLLSTLPLYNSKSESILVPNGTKYLQMKVPVDILRRMQKFRKKLLDAVEVTRDKNESDR